jgi:hypothetical protein
MKVLTLLPLIGAGLLFGPRLQAQSIRATSARVTSCAVADSTLGPDFTGDLGSVITNPTGGFKSFSLMPTSHMAGARGVVAFGASLFFPDTASRDLPDVQFNLKTVGSVRRPVDQRQLAVVVDDTLTIALGSMTAQEQDYPGDDVVENMSVLAPIHRLNQMARGKKAQGRLGTTVFSIRDSDLRDLRALLVAGLCYSTRSKSP